MRANARFNTAVWMLLVLTRLLRQAAFPRHQSRRDRDDHMRLSVSRKVPGSRSLQMHPTGNAIGLPRRESWVNFGNGSGSEDAVHLERPPWRRSGRTGMLAICGNSCRRQRKDCRQGARGLSLGAENGHLRALLHLDLCNEVWPCVSLWPTSTSCTQQQTRWVYEVMMRHMQGLEESK